MRKVLIFALTLLTLASCQGFLSPKTPGEREWDSVMILYSSGFNSLRYALTSDINELMAVSEGAFVPTWGSDKAIVIISHQPEPYKGYSVPTSPVLLHVYRVELSNEVYTDTLYRAAKGATLTDPETMRQMLSVVREAFPSRHYGAIFSSHANGWLPNGVYAKGSGSISIFNDSISNVPPEFPTLVRSGFSAGIQPGFASVADNSMTQGAAVQASAGIQPEPTLVRTFGDDASWNFGDPLREMDIREMASSIPFHLDYLIFDACLMGGVEVAYEFKDIADWIMFSPAEVLGDGMDYANVGRRLLKPGTPDLAGLCEDHWHDYEKSSVTVSLVKTSELDNLAAVCRDFFEKYRTALAMVIPGNVQGYFRYGRHWFYDLGDIAANCKPDAEDLAAVEAALDNCVARHYWTPFFMPGEGGFPINNCCGMSMYLPANGSASLDSYYKELKWNQASGLVE